jgi:putative ABC transport system substrate-binding protein
MKRRSFIAALLGSAVLSREGRAQTARKPPVIGYIGPNNEAIDRQRISSFVARLSELGWVDGRSISVEARSSNGDVARVAEIAAEFVQRPVDLIVTAGDQQVAAAKKATSAIPIVFAAAGDPVFNGLVESLARPGGNVTGQSILLTDSVGKRIDLLRDLLPGFRRLGLLGNLANSTAGPEWKAALSEARALGIESISSTFASAEQIASAVEKLQGRVDALYVCQDPLVSSLIVQINTSAMQARLPAIFSVSQLVERGGLISYGPDFLKMYRRAAEMVDKILRGTRPADIPVEQPTQFNLAINLKTASALGLNVPDVLVNRADQVIE